MFFEQPILNAPYEFFVVFGEPDFDLLNTEDDKVQFCLQGVHVCHSLIGETSSGGPETSAVRFIDRGTGQGSAV